MKRRIAWGIGIGLAVAAFAGACGNSVTDTSGSGGGSGGNGSPASSSKATTGGTGGSGGTTGTGGSSTGGGDACSMACSHAAQCGEDLCTQFPLDCTTQEGMCASACINPASCKDITAAAAWLMSMTGPPPSLVLCLAPCVEGGAGGGGQGGNGAGGGSGTACENCAGNACASQIQTCGTDMNPNGCAAWLQCAIGCNFDPACTAACDTTYAGVAAEYDPIYACACTSCATQCSGVDPCGMHPSMGGGGAPGSSTGTN